MYTLDLNHHLVRQNNIFVQQFIKLYIVQCKNQYQLTIEKEIFFFFFFSYVFSATKQVALP
jgi:hypothetical protein